MGLNVFCKPEATAGPPALIVMEQLDDELTDEGDCQFVLFNASFWLQVLTLTVQIKNPLGPKII